MSDETVADGPIEVAVIGGGCASIAAAFELTRPEHNGRYTVTVYQLGWRLGGKGASGRGIGDRIEEHGLHLWMGFYENAFRLMRECYREAQRDPRTCPIADWRDAFTADNFNAVADKSPSGAWLPWAVEFPALPGSPGDPIENYRRWTVADYMSRTAILLRTLLQAIQVRLGVAGRPPAAEQPYPTTPSAVIDGITRMLRMGQLATLGALVEALRFMEVALAAFPNYPQALILRFHEAIDRALRAQLVSFIARDDEMRRLWEIADLTLAVIRGAIADNLFAAERGFESIDHWDCRAWLRAHGASKASTNGAFIRALYDLAFAYEDGDPGRPGIAAGQALRGAVRAFFTYREAFFWKMQAGMGDVVFAPFYEVLSRRGVRFQFFHRLENVKIVEPVQGETRPHVDALEFSVQAETIGGGPYEPLISVDGLPCWPAQPRWEQLVNGEALQADGRDFESHWDTGKIMAKTLKVGVDFDLVVLGVGVGAVPFVCKEILARDQAWRDMVEHVRSVPTQACQLWMNEDMRSLGWSHGQTNISGFVEPFDTWADMSHLVKRERLGAEVKSIAYFCSVLPEGHADRMSSRSYPRERVEEVKRNAIKFMNADLGHLWPGAVCAPGRFRWEILVAAGAHNDSANPLAPPDEARIETQYVRANVNPTDRYTLSLPGSLRYRISPLDHTYDNLTVAGDWTDCGFNEGCVEAAVMSGRLAAHAISKLPRLEDIVGFDHP
jgi:uncharacterized protein with NAD-binding domain and iron-sulfur cluster